MAIVVRNVPRTPLEIVDELGAYSVATLHEAQGRKGLLDPRVRPVFRHPRVAGNALTCEVAPGDNWMIHVALGEAESGDILVVTPTSPCDNGYFGDLLATSAKAIGVRALIIDGGVRDIQELEEIGFPVWSRGISAQGTVKATLADVQVPIVCAGASISPGDVIVADADGVCVIRRSETVVVLAAARAREEAEADKRSRYASGELSLDINNMRPTLQAAGLKYVEAKQEA